MLIQDAQLHPKVIQALQELGFTEATDIQAQAIPLIKEGKDVVGQSSTGSGKTAAFAAPILDKITPRGGVQALVLTPTRELCLQVADAVRTFAKYLSLTVTSVYGGVGIFPQIEELRRAEFVIGTPGRILDHLERGTINLSRVRFLVLDEADKMFEMGFIEDVEKIISQVSGERQTLLFSATVPQTIKHMIQKHLKNPLHVKTKTYVDKSLLRQTYYVIRSHEKFSLLVHLLRQKTDQLSIVFCSTRREVDIVARNLHTNAIGAMAIHGGLRQTKRTHAMDSIKSEKISVLVATDIAARGIDIKNITHVYNYDVPKTSEEYVHRIGRTARAGMDGDAVTLLAEPDYENFNRVLMDRSLDIKRQDLPEFPRVRFVRQEHHSYGPPGRFSHHRGRPQARRGFR